MKASTNKKINPAIKRTDRRVPFDEMRRLMKVYGSLKCLRKRQPPSGAENAKIDSVKRKFYRWFPDLEERFEKGEDGCYRPKLGHEAELLYREEMRAKDGKILSEKRVSCRKQRRDSSEVTKAASTKKVNAKQAFTSSILANTVTSTSTVTNSKNCVTPSPVPSSFTDVEVASKGEVKPTSKGEAEIKLEFDHGDEFMASTSIASHVEAMDRAFTAEEGIFDDVEKSFYGSMVQGCPTLQRSSCSSSSEGDLGSSSSWESDPPSIKDVYEDSIEDSIDDMLDKSIEECCEEILGSDESDSAHFLELVSS